MGLADSGMDANVEQPLRIMIFVVNAAGCALLSVLVVSVSLSQRLHRRDPVVNNFLYTWILLSSLASFDELAVLSDKDLGNTTDVRESVLTMITMVSTLNLSIHLWYIMRSAFHQSSPRTKKLRTLALVVTPYIFGLLPVLMLLTGSAGTIVVGFFALLISIITPITDVVSLIYYWRWYRKTKKANLQGVMSLSFFLRLLAFSMYQLFYTILLILDASSGGSWGVAFKVLQNLFPLLAFCVLGLHTDILQLWFPCFWKRNGTERATDSIDLVTSNDTELGSKDIYGDQRHLLDMVAEESEEDIQKTTV